MMTDLIRSSEPVKCAQKVKWNHELEDVGAKQDIVTHGQALISHQVATIQGSGQKTSIADKSLARVEQCQ